ncbi:MAG: hypothetical protein K9G62_07540 [Alphaproteobacteria bacterium]|nr:hypothetical protein [Alphaproteobacteria bacterium]
MSDLTLDWQKLVSQLKAQTGMIDGQFGFSATTQKPEGAWEDYQTLRVDLAGKIHEVGHFHHKHIKPENQEIFATFMGLCAQKINREIDTVPPLWGPSAFWDDIYTNAR